MWPRAAPDFTAAKIKLRLYVSSPRYRRALGDGAEGIDLAGASAGIVTAKEAAKAKGTHKRQRAGGANGQSVPSATFDGELVGAHARCALTKC